MKKSFATKIQDFFENLGEWLADRWEDIFSKKKK